MDELPLFADPAAFRSERWQRLRAAVQKLAAAGVYVGTSSWKYPGWLGWLYIPERYHTRGKFSEAKFDRECLAEYAEVFKTVCFDGGYYAFPTEASMDRVYAQVPNDFRLSFKVTDEITLKRYPSLDRFGARAGQINPRFLNASLFAEAFLRPLEPYREKTGVLMFEFARYGPAEWEDDALFIAALDVFLGSLPDGWQYGVEIRNPSLLRPDYFAMLARHGVSHVFNSWHRMPGVDEQLAHEGCLTADFAAARFLLKPGRAYEDAVKRFSPYDRMQEPLPAARQAAQKLIYRLTRSSSDRKSRRRSFLFVNNRLEGNALETLLAIAEEAGSLLDPAPLPPPAPE